MNLPKCLLCAMVNLELKFSWKHVQFWTKVQTDLRCEPFWFLICRWDTLLWLWRKSHLLGKRNKRHKPLNTHTCSSSQKLPTSMQLTYKCSILLKDGCFLFVVGTLVGLGLGAVCTILGQRGVWRVLTAVCVAAGSRLISGWYLLRLKMLLSSQAWGQFELSRLFSWGNVWRPVKKPQTLIGWSGRCQALWGRRAGSVLRATNQTTAFIALGGEWMTGSGSVPLFVQSSRVSWAASAEEPKCKDT